MKILFDARMLDQGVVHGIARYLYNLVTWGLRHCPQHQIVLACAQPERWASWRKNFPQLELRHLPARPFSWKEHWLWPKLLRGVDLAHFPSLAAPLYSPCPYWMSAHDLIPWHFPSSPWHRPYLASLGRWSLARARGVFTLSEFSRQDLRRTLGVPSQKVQVIAIGGLEGEEEPRVGMILKDWQPQRPYFLCVSNPRPHKNLKLLLAAYPQLSSRCDLVVVCSPCPDLERAQAQFPGIQRFSQLSDSELRLLYRGAQALILPSLYEGFGLPPLEAMQLGTPVICSDATSLPEVVGEAALLFDPRRPEQLLQRCQQLLDQPLLASQLSQKGRERAARFSWEECCRRHWELYQETKM